MPRSNQKGAGSFRSRGEPGRQAQGGGTYALLGLLNTSVGFLLGAISRSLMLIKGIKIRFADDLKGTFRV